MKHMHAYVLYFQVYGLSYSPIFMLGHSIWKVNTDENPLIQNTQGRKLAQKIHSFTNIVVSLLQTNHNAQEQSIFYSKWL